MYIFVYNSVVHVFKVKKFKQWRLSKIIPEITAPTNAEHSPEKEGQCATDAPKKEFSVTETGINWGKCRRIGSLS